MSVFKHEIAEEFPPLTRGGTAATSEETLLIQNLLKDGKKHRLLEITSDKDYSNLQQRIRTIAKRMGISVTIRRQRETDSLFFQGELMTPVSVEEEKKVSK
jgi:hypothetical protein